MSQVMQGNVGAHKYLIWITNRGCGSFQVFSNYFLIFFFLFSFLFREYTTQLDYDDTLTCSLYIRS